MKVIPFLFLLFTASCKTLVQDEKEIEKVVDDGIEEVIEDMNE